MTLTTLVAGANSAQREAAVSRALRSDLQKYETAVLLAEGLPHGTEIESIIDGLNEIIRLAPGCMCCTGNLALRVTLNRVLRRHPERLFISIANVEHLEQLRFFLLQPAYQPYLYLTQDLII